MMKNKMIFLPFIFAIVATGCNMTATEEQKQENTKERCEELKEKKIGCMVIEPTDWRKKNYEAPKL